MRSSANRSRYGCKTCRIRKVKCDEATPSCRRCVDTGRKCDGPSTDNIVIRHYSHNLKTSSSSTQPLTVKLPRNAAFTHPEESRAFDFYLQRAAPALSGCLDKQLWQILLPQICHTDTVVRDSVLAIATLYEHPLLNAYRPPPTGIVYTSEQRKAIRWYAKSVSNVVTREAAVHELDQIESQLLTCLLFTSVEIQHANVASTIALLEHGFKLILRYLELLKTHHRQTSTWIQELVIPTLVRQTVTFGVFGHALTSEAYAAIDQLIPSKPTEVSSLKGARDILFAILIRSFMFVQHISILYYDNGSPPADAHERQVQLLNWLQSWRIEAHRLSDNHHPSDEPLTVLHTLLCWHQVCYLWLSRSLNGRLNGDTEELQCFRSIIFHAQNALQYMNLSLPDPNSRPFVLELGVMPALFFVAWQCRNPEICRQAIELMKRCPAQESLLVTELQIKALEQVLIIEEQLSTLNTAYLACEDTDGASAYHEQIHTLEALVDRSLFLPRRRPLVVSG